MRFLLPLSGASLMVRIRKQFGTASAGREDCRMKWHSHAQMTPPKLLAWQAYFVTLLKDRTLVVQKEDGYSSPFSVGVGDDVNLILAEQ
jgi:hypothetical protein